MDEIATDTSAADRFEISRMAERGISTYAPTALRLVRACDLYRDIHARMGLIAERWDGGHPIVRAPTGLRDELEIGRHVRSTLDYCAYQTVFRDNGSPKSGTQFPLVDDEKSFEKILKNPMPGITRKHRSWVEGVQP